MTKTNVQLTPSIPQHHDTPNNKTHVIKFRVTENEKLELECTAKLLNLSLSTFIRRAIHNVKIEKTVIVAGGGEETLTAVSTLLAQCSKVGGNLNQLARHFNSGGADTEQIRAKILDELADLTAFRLHAEKVLGELYGNAQALKRILFTSMMRSPGSNFWMNTADRSCGNPTCSTPLSAAISRLQRPVCWRTASMARTPSMVILRVINISSALTPEMQPTTA